MTNTSKYSDYFPLSYGGSSSSDLNSYMYKIHFEYTLEYEIHFGYTLENVIETIYTTFL